VFLLSGDSTLLASSVSGELSLVSFLENIRRKLDQEIVAWKRKSTQEIDQLCLCACLLHPCLLIVLSIYLFVHFCIGFSNASFIYDALSLLVLNRWIGRRYEIVANLS
jgi:hypothetical protein